MTIRNLITTAGRAARGILPPGRGPASGAAAARLHAQRPAPWHATEPDWDIPAPEDAGNGGPGWDPWTGTSARPREARS